jgi:hypothetical protein
VLAPRVIDLFDRLALDEDPVEELELVDRPEDDIVYSLTGVS